MIQQHVKQYANFGGRDFRCQMRPQENVTTAIANLPIVRESMTLVLPGECKYLVLQSDVQCEVKLISSDSERTTSLHPVEALFLDPRVIDVGKITAIEVTLSQDEAKKHGNLAIGMIQGESNET